MGHSINLLGDRLAPFIATIVIIALAFPSYATATERNLTDLENHYLAERQMVIDQIITFNTRVKKYESDKKKYNVNVNEYNRYVERKKQLQAIINNPSSSDTEVTAAHAEWQEVLQWLEANQDASRMLIEEDRRLKAESSAIDLERIRLNNEQKRVRALRDELEARKLECVDLVRIRDHDLPRYYDDFVENFSEVNEGFLRAQKKLDEFRGWEVVDQNEWRNAVDVLISTFESWVQVIGFAMPKADAIQQAIQSSWDTAEVYNNCIAATATDEYECYKRLAVTAASGSGEVALQYIAGISGFVTTLTDMKGRFDERQSIKARVLADFAEKKKVHDAFKTVHDAKTNGLTALNNYREMIDQKCK